MAVRKIGWLLKGSMWVIAAGALTACGGNGSDGQVSVPNVVGDTQVAASAAISGAGLTVGTVTPQSSSSVASGDVILQDPAAGASVNSGTAVGLFVSSGPATPVVISGTVASGTALTGTVSVYDSSASAQPRSTGTVIAAGGQYSVTATGFTAPFLIQATGQVGGQGPTVTLYAVATAGGTVNLTPITTLIALNMAAGNLQSLLTGAAGALPGLTAADLRDQNTQMDTLFSSVLAALTALGDARTTSHRLENVAALAHWSKTFAAQAYHFTKTLGVIKTSQPVAPIGGSDEADAVLAGAGLSDYVEMLAREDRP